MTDEYRRHRVAACAFENKQIEAGVCIGPLDCRVNSPLYCHGCGWNVKEDAYRRERLAKEGLTVGPDGLLHLNLEEVE